ncbi:MAG TPA: hypothetical protein VJ852_09475, partial [Gemmatimonadaceae bacterium]|nr:hypothetical protein [Gemmatimonadaceae bacterium]
SIVTREIDFSSGLLQTPYCPRNLVGSEFYISGTEPTRDCDKHGPYSQFGIPQIDTGPIPLTPPIQPSPSTRTPVNVTPPPLQPGYEPVPSGNQRRSPTVFDTATRRDTARRPTIFDTTRRRPPRRDSARTPTDTAIPPVPPTNPR